MLPFKVRLANPLATAEPECEVEVDAEVLESAEPRRFCSFAEPRDAPDEEERLLCAEEEGEMDMVGLLAGRREAWPSLLLVRESHFESLLAPAAVDDTESMEPLEMTGRSGFDGWV